MQPGLFHGRPCQPLPPVRPRRDAFRRYRNPCGIGIKLSWIRGSAADGKLGKHASGCTELYDHDPGVVVPAVPGPDDPAHCVVL